MRVQQVRGWWEEVGAGYIARTQARAPSARFILTRDRIVLLTQPENNLKVVKWSIAIQETFYNVDIRTKN